jgi:hypothetical protein
MVALAMERGICPWLAGVDPHLSVQLCLARSDLTLFEFCRDLDLLLPYFSFSDVNICLDKYLNLSSCRLVDQTCCQLAGPPRLTEYFLQALWSAHNPQGQPDLSRFVLVAFENFMQANPPPPTATLQQLYRLVYDPETFQGVRQLSSRISFPVGSSGYVKFS